MVKNQVVVGCLNSMEKEEKSEIKENKDIGHISIKVLESVENWGPQTV